MAINILAHRVIFIGVVLQVIYVPPHNILQGCCTQEILLFQSKLFPLKNVVIWIQNSGNIFSQIPVQNRLDVGTVIN